MESSPPANWKLLPIQDMLEAVIDYRGKTPPKTATGIPTLTAANVKNGRIDLSTVSYVSRETYKRWITRGLPKPNDVLITTEAPVGQVAPFPGDQTYLMTRRVIALRGKSDQLDNRFLLYSLMSMKVQSHLWGLVRGTTVPRVLKPDILGIKLNIPPIGEQRCIANIISTLDNKIELNRQMNATLEAMAQALFKSWFVDFDPVIDNALAAGNPIPDPLQTLAEARKALRDQRKPLPEGIQNQFPNRFVFNDDLGWVPEGWESLPLADLCSEITDGSHSSPKSVEHFHGLPMASSKDLTKQGINFSECRHIDKEDFAELQRNGCSPKKGDVLISKDGSRCGETCCVFLSDHNVVLLSSVAILRPKSSIYSNYINTLLSRKTTIKNLRENYVSGSAIPRIVLRDFKRYPVLHANKKLIRSWNDQVQILTEKAILIEKKSLSLTSLRDTLLPKLLSGHLRIPKVEQQVAEAL